MRADRNPALDGLRGIAILLVMPFHFTKSFEAHGVADRILGSAAATGYLGVDLFFVLSGYLITTGLLQARGSGNYFSRFYARRVLRIFPLYYCLIALIVLVAPRVPAVALTRPVQLTQAHQAWFWVHAVNWLTAINGTFDVVAHETSVIWSLSIEEQFYLIWPVLVLVLGARRLPGVCALLIAVSTGLRAWLLTHGSALVTVYTATITRLDGLALGAALACLAQSTSPPPAVRLIRRSWYLSLLAFDVAFFVPVQRTVSHIALTAVFLCAAIGWGGVLLRTLDAGPTTVWGRVVRAEVLQRFGLYSYGLYLLHPWVEASMPKLGLSARALTRAVGSSFGGHVLYLAIATTIAFVAAAASYHLFEARFLALKNRIPILAGRGSG